jgi:hypothetical protein
MSVTKEALRKTALSRFGGCVREPGFMNSVPEGRLNLAQDVSPGLIREATSPAGTTENRQRRNSGQFSAVPTGLNQVA